MRARAALLLLVLTAGCPDSTGPAPQPGAVAGTPAAGAAAKTAAAEQPPPPPRPAGAYEDWYPRPLPAFPGRLAWPLPLEPLPRDLEGVPPAEQRFVNHCFARIVLAAQAKVVLLNELEAARRKVRAVDLRATFGAYVRALERARQGIRDEVAPGGLARFQALVLAALSLQEQVLAGCVRALEEGRAWVVEQRLSRPPGAPGSKELLDAYARRRQGTLELLEAWAVLSKHGAGWPEPLRACLRAHLKALDLH